MLVQGEKSETQIKGDKVAIDGKTGNLLAQGSVISQMVVQDIDPATKERVATRSIAYAQQMQDEDAVRKVTYTTKAHLIGPQGDLTGETIVLTLGTNGQDIERLEAAVDVKLTEVNRITIGDQLTYDAAKEEVQRRRQRQAGADVQARGRRNLPAQRRQFFDLLQRR